MAEKTKPMKTALVPLTQCSCLEERAKNVLLEALDLLIETDNKQIGKVEKEIVKLQDEIAMLPEKFQEEGAPATYSHLSLEAHFAFKNMLERHLNDAQEIIQFVSKKPVCKGGEAGGSAGGSELPLYVPHRETPPAKMKLKPKKIAAAAAVEEEQKPEAKYSPKHGEVKTRKMTAAERKKYGVEET